ncbi:MAG: hypothetical protein Q4G60_08035 [bacterium]|nr:hypothetical protein [bacterium]
MISGRFFMEREEDRNRILHDMDILYPTEPAAEKTKRYFKEKKKYFFLALMGGILFAILLEISTLQQSVLQTGNRIARGSYDTGSKTVHLSAYYNDGSEKEDISMQISGQQYSLSETERMYTEMMKQLPSIILGENSSFDEVRKHLNLVKRVEGYPFHIRWQPDSYRLIDQYGTIHSEEIEEEGSVTRIKAVITYEDYQAESVFHIRLYPQLLTEQEKFIEEIHQEVEKRNAASVTDAEIQLPDQIEKKEIIWREKKSHESLYLLLLTIVCSVTLYYGKDMNLHKQVEQRRKEMKIDYVEIISKLALFLGAGMTTKGAWKKIVTDYEKACHSGMKKRYAYEEMMITYHEMCSGVSESTAYERFGRRSELPCYQILASIISQSVKRGAKGTVTLLLREMTGAFEERKSIARQLGEEAGTKLLIPMFMMLLIVMLMIVLPAFLSLQGVS